MLLKRLLQNGHAEQHANLFTIRHNKKDGGMSISKTFFFKLKSVAKTLKNV